MVKIDATADDDPAAPLPLAERLADSEERFLASLRPEERAPTPSDAEVVAWGRAFEADGEMIQLPKAKEPPAPTLMGLPLSMFVRGGTQTSGDAAQIAAFEADAEGRRNDDDESKRLARVPIAQGGAELRSLPMSSSPEAPKAYVLLDYMMRGGGLRIFMGAPLRCLADIVVLGPEELGLQLVCPKCVETRPQGQAQILVRQSNRKWTLDVSKAGQLIIFEGNAYMSAGVVMDSERFSCTCGWQARISDSKVRPE